jgi:hypothetical protein
VTPAFTLITGDQRATFASLVQRQGWRGEDFELQEEAFDQRTAEVEARKGQVGVRCLKTEAIMVYPLGDGSDWLVEFGADLEAGKFGHSTSA